MADETIIPGVGTEPGTDDGADYIAAIEELKRNSVSREEYDKLAKESWFNVGGVTAGNYLSSDLYDFYLIIRIHDYRLQQLSEEEQQNVINSLANIEKRLLETYGENASFEILHAEYTVKYADGVKL